MLAWECSYRVTSTAQQSKQKLKWLVEAPVRTWHAIISTLFCWLKSRLSSEVRRTKEATPPLLGRGCQPHVRATGRDKELTQLEASLERKLVSVVPSWKLRCDCMFPAAGQFCAEKKMMTPNKHLFLGGLPAAPRSLLACVVLLKVVRLCRLFRNSSR